MGFKTVTQYNEERYGGLFRLPNDQDSAEVIFLYQSAEDVLVADTHYIKSADYSGYVHCNGKGCPACAKGIRVQTKLFIPLYNISAGEVQFWDRTMKFEPQLHSDVFSKFPNPSEFVFRITRNGVAGSIDTTYSITAVGSNRDNPYSVILANNNIKMPDYYENICRDVTASELSSWLTAPATATTYSANDMPAYVPTPRASAPVAAAAPPPTTLDYIEEADAPETIDDDVDF